ncbi:hypothetical protein fugu_020080 [Takifugu bimaculatus]|uniref:Uncharacterized protein n=1 Tax=Takifugu bimaculatus TaxID=433685 RepID=A0A4Z2BKG3_9TELE|nr:hypothetical protein fugu_020080 [Takifugu bimaculatus]
MAAAGASGKTYSFKAVLLGEGCVGKTSLVLRYCENKFNDKHITTLQASFLTKKLNITGKRVNLAIWDTRVRALPRACSHLLQILQRLHPGLPSRTKTPFRR